MNTFSCVSFALTVVLLFSPVNARGQSAIPDWDVALSRSDAFTIELDDDTSWVASSEISVEMKLLSKRSTSSEYLTVDEPYYAPIRKLKVKVNSSTISDSYISHGISAQSDAFLPGHKVYTILFPSSLKVGDVVSYSYKQQYSDIAFLPVLSIPNTDYVEKYTATFEHPGDVMIDFEFSFPRDTIPYAIDRHKPTQTILSFGKVAFVDKLKFFPSDSYHAAMLVMVRRRGKVINPVLPADFAAWYFKKTPPLPRLDSGDVRKLNGTIVRKEDALGNVRAAYDYVRKTIRYIADERGLNAIIPRSPSATLSTQFGDCKDRVALVSAIAGEQGVAAIPVLVPTAASPRFNGVHTTMFNHVINGVVQGPRIVFCDPTSRYCAFGNLPDGDVQKRVFLLDSSQARFVTTPIPERKPTLDIAVTARLDSLHACTASIILRNGLLQAALYARHDFTKEKFRHELQSALAGYLYQVRLDDFEVVGEEEGSLTLSARLDLSAFILQSGERFYVPRTPFAQFDNDVLEREGDRFPVIFPSTVDLAFSLCIDAHSATVHPDSMQIDGGGFAYSARAGNAGGTIQCTYRYCRNTTIIETDMKRDFFRTYKAYLENKKNVFVLTRR